MTGTAGPIIIKASLKIPDQGPNCPARELLKLRTQGNRRTLGESCRAPANGGPACRRNANGDVIVHRDRPMETAYRQAKRHWKESRGRYGSEDHSQIVDVPFKRYPRTETPPYSVELNMRRSDDGVMHVVAGPFAFNTADDERAANTANMFIELFGECGKL